MRRFLAFALAVVAPLALMPGAVLADSDTHTYELEMEGPNFGVAANGDCHISVDATVRTVRHSSKITAGAPEDALGTTARHLV